MRETSLSRKVIDDQKILDAHPWYSEFINKIMDSPKGELSHYEKVLIEEIQG